MTAFKPDNTMLNNYIQNKLNESETEQMELWLLDHPKVIQELELDLMFKQANFEINNVNETIKKPSFSWLGFFSTPKFAPIHALSYGLVALLVFNTFNNNPETTQTYAATFIELEKQRGLDTSVMEVQTIPNKSLVLRFFPDSMETEYNLVMQSKSSDTKFEFEKLMADEYGSITITINSVKNIVGEWEVLVFDDTSQVEQNYLININD